MPSYATPVKRASASTRVSGEERGSGGDVATKGVKDNDGKGPWSEGTNK